MSRVGSTLVSRCDNRRLNKHLLYTISPFRQSMQSKVVLEDTARNPQLLNIDLQAKNWSVAHNTKSNDSTFRATWKPLSDVKVNITQKAPKGKFFLVPNPHVKVTKSGIIGKNDSASLEHDMMERSSGASMVLYRGDDGDSKRHKLKLSANSKSGLNGMSGMVRSKVLKGTLLHSVSASGTKDSQVLTLKSRIRGDDQKLKTKVSYTTGKNSLTFVGAMRMCVDDQKYKAEMSYVTATKSLTMEGIHETKIDGKKVKTTLNLSAPVTNFSKPQMQIGFKVDL